MITGGSGGGMITYIVLLWPCRVVLTVTMQSGHWLIFTYRQVMCSLINRITTASKGRAKKYEFAYSGASALSERLNPRSKALVIIIEPVSLELTVLISLCLVDRLTFLTAIKQHWGLKCLWACLNLTIVKKPEKGIQAESNHRQYPSPLHLQPWWYCKFFLYHQHATRKNLPRTPSRASHTLRAWPNPVPPAVITDLLPFSIFIHPLLMIVCGCRYTWGFDWHLSLSAFWDNREKLYCDF